MLIFHRYDSRISTFAETKFARDGIDVHTGCRVLSVSDKEVNMKIKSTGENVSMPHGMVVWSTGVATRPVVKDFMDQIGQVCYLVFSNQTSKSFLFCLFTVDLLYNMQGKRKVLATDEWLRVKGSENVYAIGDCATIDQRRVMVF